MSACVPLPDKIWYESETEPACFMLSTKLPNPLAKTTVVGHWKRMGVEGCRVTWELLKTKTVFSKQMRISCYLLIIFNASLGFSVHGYHNYFNTLFVDF